MPAFFANGAAACPSSLNVKQLVQEVVRNEVHARSDPPHYYAFVERDETAQSVQTTLQIETRKGRVSRLIKVNGKPPAIKQCEKARSLLRRIASQPRLQRSRLRNQQQEMARRESLIAAFPDAFLYQNNGTEEATGLIRLGYRPNPDFRPRQRTQGVLMGLEGTMWIDPSSHRLVRINGHLSKAVTFGWGLLAKLNRGGRFDMEQSKLADGNWRLARLQVKMQGTILVFKKLDVNMKDTFSSFKDVPANLTLGQAVARLEKVPVHCGGQ